jgi:hypothetical protein
MNLQIIGHSAGLFGDALNLLGAYILAKDVLDREREWAEEKDLEELGKQLREAGIPAIYEGIPITRPNAVALSIVVRAVKRGRVGFTLMGIGFVFLIVYRVCELANLWLKGGIG